jgi:hypothetical protein
MNPSLFMNYDFPCCELTVASQGLEIHESYALSYLRSRFSHPNAAWIYAFPCTDIFTYLELIDPTGTPKITRNV